MQNCIAMIQDVSERMQSWSGRFREQFLMIQKRFRMIEKRLPRIRNWFGRIPERVTMIQKTFRMIRKWFSMMPEWSGLVVTVRPSLHHPAPEGDAGSDPHFSILLAMTLRSGLRL
jgi:hypothetical protein